MDPEDPTTPRFSLLDLPGTAIAALVGAVKGRDRERLRSVCHRLRTAANAATTKITVARSGTSWHYDPSYPLKSLAHAAQQFPNIQHIHFDYFDSEWAQSRVTDALAALPAGCWPAAKRVTTSYRRTIPLAWAAQLARLCPRLQEAVMGGCAVRDREALQTALGGPGQLRALDLELHLAAIYEPGDARRAAAAVARLAGLRRLRLGLPSRAPAIAAGVVAAALPALTALTELELAFDAAAPEIRLACCPATLRALTLEALAGRRGLDVLEATELLPGVTRLEISMRRSKVYRRSDVLALAAAKCRALEDLCVRDAWLGPVPAGAFAHLTRLELDRCEFGGEWQEQVPRAWPRPSLAQAAPRLEVLVCSSCGGEAGHGIAAAAEDHPALREVRLPWLNDLDKWGGYLESLPRLSSLAVDLTDDVWGDEEPAWGYAGALARANTMTSLVREAADSIGRCSHITRLELSGHLRLPLQFTLACLRAEFGGRLRHLVIGYGMQLPAPAAARKALDPLPSFTRLERLELSVQTGDYTSGGVFDYERIEATVLALLEPLDALLPRCGALRHLSFTMGGSIDVPCGLARVCERCRALTDAHPGKLITFENEREGQRSPS